MTTEPALHSAAIARVILSFAASHGVEQSGCLDGTGLTPAALEEAEATITREQELKLLTNLYAALPDLDALGFELGTQFNASAFGAWGFALSISKTFRDGVKRAIRYLPLSTAYCHVVDRLADDELLLIFDPSPIPAPLTQMMLERDMSTGVVLARELTHKPGAIKRIEFEALLPYKDRIEQILGAPVHLGCAQNAIVLDAAIAEEPFPHYNEKLVRLLDDQCRQLMDRLATQGIDQQIRRALLGPLGLAASLEDVAAALNLAPRALRRKLEDDGTNFRAILDDTRRHLADQLLTGTTMKLDEMAYHLGYGDTASFTRAFRRWHGMSPGAYRKQQ
ncbi:MAG: AraC family transcriptional regulator [Alphaproteobacteria bacterium]